MLCAGTMSLALVLAGCAPGGKPIVAEVYYDAPGDDTGHEFVELFNPLDRPYPLTGLRLEAGDGAGPGRWTVRWSAAPTDTIGTRARFVIGGEQVTPAVDRVATLDLQNGPDALRAVWPDGAIEIVGYGAHDLPEYACGEPAPDVSSGQALARVPDDSDRGANAADFVAASPTPGRPNRPGKDVALLLGSLVVDPERPAESEWFRVRGRALNRGAEAVGPGAATIAVGEGDGGPALLPPSPLPAGLAPAETLAFEFAIPPIAPGKRWLVARLSLAGDEAPENDADSLRLRVGDGPFRVTEIQFHPSAGEGEWVEIQRRGDPGDLIGCSLSDRTGTRGVVAEAAMPLEPDSFVVLAQDRAAFLVRYPEAPGARVIEVDPWPALNNSDDAQGVADAVILREPDGTLADRVAYSATGVPAGVPIEPVGDSWVSSALAAGTPLAAPRSPPQIAGSFEIRPRRLRAGGDARVMWSLPWARSLVEVDLYDLSGRRVGRVLEGAGAKGERAWRPGDVPGGVYVAVLRARDERGAGVLVTSQAIRVEGAAR